MPSSVPYPLLTASPTGSSDNDNADTASASTSTFLSLSAVGRCRIDPTTTTTTTTTSSSTTNNTTYQQIVDKTKQQAHAAAEAEGLSGDEQKEKKKLAKKYMKESVAMAKSYLRQEWKVDCSIVDIEIVLEAQNIIESDGCFASCFLDAGCQTIVCKDGSNLDALEASKIPSERLMGHFHFNSTTTTTTTGDAKQLFESIDNATKQYCSSISVEIDNKDDVTESNMMSIVESVQQQQSQKQNQEGSTTNTTPPEVVIQLPESYVKDTTGDDDEKLAAVVASVCSNSSSRSKVTVCLPNPTPSQLGRSYVAACLRTDRDDGLYTTVVCTRSGIALGLVYSSQESVVASLECGRGVYFSRSRNQLWRKGDTSGNYQVLHRMDVDCDGDAIRFTVTQKGSGGEQPAFCHLNTLTCWGIPKGLQLLEGTLQDRLQSAPTGSYTKRLFDDSTLLRNKLVEEAQELCEADNQQHVAEELADVIYFAMCHATKYGVSLDDVAGELDCRARKVTRRQGDSKAFRIAAGQAILDNNKNNEEGKEKKASS